MEKEKRVNSVNLYDKNMQVNNCNASVHTQESFVLLSIFLLELPFFFFPCLRFP